MSTGHLEGRLCGKKAKEVFTAAKPLSKEDPNQLIKLCTKQPITKYTISISRGMNQATIIQTKFQFLTLIFNSSVIILEASVQCLLLNIKLIIYSLRTLFKDQTDKQLKGFVILPQLNCEI
jgi:hypothetical protein